MLLSLRQFLVKERVSAFRLTDTYDIFDPQSGQQVGIARDEPPSWAKWLRMLVNKHFLPTTVNVYEREGQPPVLTLQKGQSFFRSTLALTDAQGRVLGSFRSKVLSLGGGFYIDDGLGNPLAEVKGDWKGWNFRFLDTEGRELGQVTKKWAGLGKELFTSADNYVISLADDASGGSRGGGADRTALLLAAGLAIDTVFKEKK
jgi:uncharacterized protein YxjI